MPPEARRIDARMRAHELGQRSDQLVLSEGVRHHHPQRALGVLARPAQLVFELIPAGQQFLGALVAALAILGHLHGVGGALQQAHAQRAFQRLQATTDGGLGSGELGGGGREAAGLDDAHEGLDQFDAVGQAGGRETGGRGGGLGHTANV